MPSPDVRTTDRPVRWLPACLLFAALAGCSGDDAGDVERKRAASAEPASGLPAPEGAVGSVTGMPAQPGPGTVPLGGSGGAPARASISTGDGSAAAQGNAADDGGLDAMAVETDYPDIAQGEPVAPATAPPVPPVIIVPTEPRRTLPPEPAPEAAPADATAPTTFVTEVPVDDDAD